MLVVRENGRETALPFGRNGAQRRNGAGSRDVGEPRRWSGGTQLRRRELPVRLRGEPTEMGEKCYTLNCGSKTQ